MSARTDAIREILKHEDRIREHVLFLQRRNRTLERRLARVLGLFRGTGLRVWRGRIGTVVEPGGARLAAPAWRLEREAAVTALGPCLRYWAIRQLDRLDDALGHPWLPLCRWISVHPWWGA